MFLTRESRIVDFNTKKNIEHVPRVLYIVLHYICHEIFTCRGYIIHMHMSKMPNVQSSRNVSHLRV